MTTKRNRRNVSSNPNAAIIYCRVSASESQSDSDISLKNQETVLTAAAHVAGYSEVLVVAERHTASKTQPELVKALQCLLDGQASALFAHKIDRLSRKGAADVLRIADLAEAQGWRLVVSDVALDTGTTVGRLVLTILSGVAEMESRRRSERMTDYHSARKRKGEIAGLTYGVTTKASGQSIAIIAEARQAGMTWRAISEMLNEQDADKRLWYPAAVRRTYLSPAARYIA